MVMANPASLPAGFRFHPTDQELILHYLKIRAASDPCPAAIIAEVDIYKFDPWDLPAKAMYGDKEWYFFSPRDRKYPNGVRPNRAAASGYWKATGTDKPIHDSKSNEYIGVKKALVFYKGRPPRGQKTNWIMHEYRLSEGQGSSTPTSYRPTNKFKGSSMRLDDWVLCRIYKKSNHVSSDQEDLGLEDQNCTLPVQSFSHQSTGRMPKSSSLSELFLDYSAISHLLDGMPELPGPGPDASSPWDHQSLNQYLFSCTNETETPAAPLGAEGSMKRQRTTDLLDEGIGMSHASKRQSLSCNVAADFGIQSSALPQTFLGQPVLGQQMLMSSTFGMR